MTAEGSGAAAVGSRDAGADRSGAPGAGSRDGTVQGPCGPGVDAPRTVRRPSDVRAAARALRSDCGTLALVPTMGFLHEGHLRLVDRARELCGAVVLSIFVNPTQFGPGEDFEAYPRDLERDLELAASRGVDLVFAPDPEAMYPVPPTISVDPGPLAHRLCGLGRPGHFAGVLTVVLKLLHLVEPDVAVFGRKDLQQLVLVRRMATELDLDVRIEGTPIVREPDGLALSSRNAYLSDADRAAAGSLSLGLRRARRSFAAGERRVGELERLALRTMESAGAEVEYARIVDPESLEPLREASAEGVCAVAARVGPTRLIDNATLGGASSLDDVDVGG